VSDERRGPLTPFVCGRGKVTVVLGGWFSYLTLDGRHLCDLDDACSMASLPQHLPEEERRFVVRAYSALSLARSRLEGWEEGAGALDRRDQALARIAALPLHSKERHEAMRRASRSWSVPLTCVRFDGCGLDGNTEATTDVVWPDGERWPADPEKLRRL